MALTSRDGGIPIVVTGRSESALVHYDKNHAETSGRAFEPNAARRALRIRDQSGGRGLAHAYMLNEEPSKQYGVLGRLEIIEEGHGTHPADIYWLYPDQNIEHVRRTAENDGVDEEGYDINWREINTHIRWLNPEQMEELQLRIEEAQPIP
jgi:hypothetical protein